jgi:hypothetical protein
MMVVTMTMMMRRRRRKNRNRGGTFVWKYPTFANMIPVGEHIRHSIASLYLIPSAEMLSASSHPPTSLHRFQQRTQSYASLFTQKYMVIYEYESFFLSVRN